MSQTATTETPTSHPENLPTAIDELERQRAIDHLADLLRTHWREAEDSQDDEGKFAIGFKVAFDRSTSPTKLRVTCRISKTFSDEIESEIEDPRQAQLF